MITCGGNFVSGAEEAAALGFEMLLMQGTRHDACRRSKIFVKISRGICSRSSGNGVCWVLPSALHESARARARRATKRRQHVNGQKQYRKKENLLVTTNK